MPLVLFLDGFGCENLLRELHLDRWAVYTEAMNEFLNNRYVQLSLLTALIALFIYALIWIILSLVGLDEFPQFLRITISVLGAGLLVYKFFEQRIG